MIRYLLILLAGGVVFLGLSYAWPQEKPARQAPDKSPQATQENQADGKQPVNPFSRPNNKNGAKDQKRMEEKVILSQLPGLKLRGILKLKDQEPVGLLEVATRDDKEVHPVRKGDEISVTLPGEDIIRTSDLVGPPPESPAGQQGEPKTQNKQVQQNNKQGEGQQVGVQTRPSPRIRLKEIQVVLKVVEISRKGVYVEALPLKERILVR